MVHEVYGNNFFDVLQVFEIFLCGLLCAASSLLYYKYITYNFTRISICISHDSLCQNCLPFYHKFLYILFISICIVFSSEAANGKVIVPKKLIFFK